MADRRHPEWDWLALERRTRGQLIERLNIRNDAEAEQVRAFLDKVFGPL